MAKGSSVWVLEIPSDDVVAIILPISEGCYSYLSLELE